MVVFCDDECFMGQRLSSLEARWPFFSESFHALFHVLGREQEIEILPLELQSFVEWRVESFQNGFLCQASGDRGFLGDLHRELSRFVEICFDRNYSVDESMSLHLSRGHWLTG